jgi:predicted unusual protein kinase regulating ubiquinone biosynthesis (AarF/ABC1/UbiB family)
MAVCKPAGNSATHAQNESLDAALQVLTALAKLALLQVQNSTAAPPGASYAASVRQLVSQLGVLWVKLGQTLSVRPDLVGKRFAAALAGLQVGDWRC